MKFPAFLHFRYVVESILNSCFWEESIKPYDTRDDMKNGNLRLLATKYQDLLEKVLDKCMPIEAETVKEKQKHEADRRRYILRYLDEAYPVSGNARFL